MRKVALLAALTAAVAGGARAGTLFSTVANQNLFGNTYPMDIYRVANDLQPLGPRLEPEGMTWYNGNLYVTGDASAVTTPTESNGYVAVYPNGDLSLTPTPLGQFATGGRAIGAEGVTINTRGAGYGSFPGVAPLLTVVDNAGGSVGRILAALDPAGPSVGQIQSGFINSDDIAYVPGASAASDRFAVLNGGTTPPSIVWFSTDATPLALPGGFDLEEEAKGLVYLPKSQAKLFSSLADADCLMVGVGPNNDNLNKLRLYDLAGNLLDSATIAAGTGPGLLGAIEALAFDPVSRTLFLGDENGASSQIAKITVPEPASALLLGLAAALTATIVGRRRG